MYYSQLSSEEKTAAIQFRHRFGTGVLFDSLDCYFDLKAAKEEQTQKQSENPDKLFKIIEVEYPVFYGLDDDGDYAVDCRVDNYKWSVVNKFILTVWEVIESILINRYSEVIHAR